MQLSGGVYTLQMPTMSRDLSDRGWIQIVGLFFLRQCTLYRMWSCYMHNQISIFRQSIGTCPVSTGHYPVVDIGATTSNFVQNRKKKITDMLFITGRLKVVVVGSVIYQPCCGWAIKTGISWQAPSKSSFFNIVVVVIQHNAFIWRTTLACMCISLHYGIKCQHQNTQYQESSRDREGDVIALAWIINSACVTIKTSFTHRSSCCWNWLKQQCRPIQHWFWML